VTTAEKEEERRLLYVAMTRAKEHLIFYVPYKQPWEMVLNKWQDPHLSCAPFQKNFGMENLTK